jgi:glycosyltransferase involved in cell wall biosynthesis
MQVAVLLPVYNRPRSVVEALQSVRAQTHAPKRVVVVDDGSQDETPQRVEDFFRDHPISGGELIRQANAGPSAARNRAASVASDCDVLAFLDSDDLWPEDYLQRVAEAFEADPKAVAVTCDYVQTNSGLQKTYHARCDWVEQHTSRRFFLSGYDRPGTPSTAIRRADFERVGGYDERVLYGEDMQMMMRVSLLGAWRFAAGAPVIVRQGKEVHTGEAPHMSELHPERSWWNAWVFDRFIFQDGGAEVVPAHEYLPVLARLWYRAGQKYLKLGEPGRARPCFDRCLELRPLHIKSRWRAWRLGKVEPQPWPVIEPRAEVKL